MEKNPDYCSRRKRVCDYPIKSCLEVQGRCRFDTREAEDLPEYCNSKRMLGESRRYCYTEMVCLKGEGKCSYDGRKMTMEAIQARLKEIDSIMSPLYPERDVLMNMLSEVKCKEMFETGALTEREWSTRDSGHGITLYSNTNQHKKLADLFEHDYHCSEHFEGWDLNFSDGDIILRFEETDKALEFIKKHQLKVTLKDLEEDVKDLDDKKKKLEKFIEKIKTAL